MSGKYSARWGFAPAVSRLKHPLEHFSYASLEEYVEKCNQYTTLAAQDQWERGRRFSHWDHLRPAWELFQRVVLKGAWLDGHAGLTYAALSSHAAWLRAIKLKQYEKNPSIHTPSAATAPRTKDDEKIAALRS